MAFNVSNLTDYTQMATELLREFALYSESYSRFDYMTGIMHKQYLNYINTDVYAQAGACGLSASGSTMFDEKEIQVFPIAFRNEFCVDDLNSKDLNFNTGTLNGKMVPDLQTNLIATSADSIKKTLDNLVFKGNTGSGDILNGWATQLVADSGSTINTTSGLTVTISNIDDIVTEMISSVSEAMWARNTKLYIHMGLDYFNLYKQNRINANFYNDNPNYLGLRTMDVFGWSEVALVAEPGLTGTKIMFLTWDNNLVIGTDDVNEISSAKMYFDENTDKVKYKASLKLGVSYKFTGEIVLFQGV